MRVSVINTSAQIAPLTISDHSTLTTVCGAGMMLAGSIAAAKYQIAMRVKADAILMMRSPEYASIQLRSLNGARAGRCVARAAVSSTVARGDDIGSIQYGSVYLKPVRKKHANDVAGILGSRDLCEAYGFVSKPSVTTNEAVCTLAVRLSGIAQHKN
jgi:hypothetical protein